MGKALVGGLMVAVVAALILYVYASSCRTAMADQARQISALGAQLAKLEQQNTELRTNLAKLQSEEEALAAQNDELKKAIATFKATGKMPANLPSELPSPPK
jgi:septal ring factor EnvC (AmiA/AmiB activator)